MRAPANVKSAITLVRARNERRYDERAMACVAERWKQAIGTRFQVQLMRAPANVKSAVTLATIPS
jgi:aromatic ring-cleaving dioxygenase